MRPNFLFIITDQQRADHLGCYGNPVVRTPNIDRLAAHGFRAERFYVANPVCMPNRASLATGRMPSLHGVRHNGIELSHGELTFVEVLRQSGYRTHLVGKAHFQNISDTPAGYPSAAEAALRPARRPDAGRHGQELESSWELDPGHDLEYPYYGFSHADLTTLHGDEQNGHWRRWLRAQIKDADALIGPQNALPTPDLALNACRQAWRTRVPAELSPNQWITDRTIDAVRDCARSGDPFFIHCSYPDPHHPFTPAGEYWGRYGADDVPLPHSYGAPHRNMPSLLRWAREMREAGKAVKHTQSAFAPTEREAREAIALNYCTIGQIDDGVGRIMRALADLGLDETTVVVFTSDHGDFMGDHQLLLKGPTHYAGTIRVPFIWRDPQNPPARTSGALLQSIDLAPTIIERAGAEPIAGIQGRSMLAIFSGRAAALRDVLLIEDERQRPAFDFPNRARLRTLITPTHRLSMYEGSTATELYDLENDPEELDNLWPEDGMRSLKSFLTEALAQALMSTSETIPYPTSLA